MNSKRFLLALLVLGILLIPTALPAATLAAPQLDPQLPLHPALQYGAQRDPKRKLTVIVQKTSASVSTAAIAATVDKKVDPADEFPLIAAFPLEIEQSQAPTLARAAGVRYVSLEARVKKTGSIKPTDLAELQTTHQGAAGITATWTQAGGATGNGITIAVLDTGLEEDEEAFGPDRLCVTVNKKSDDCKDDYGHGTHVGGIVAGRDKDNRYLGVAPDARLLSVKVANKEGGVREADVLRGLEWIAANQQSLNIRVVNLSLSIGLPGSYVNSPVDAAVEELWRRGVVVVAAAGNQGMAPNATHFAPGNDPFIITVGALDHNGTVDPSDDRLADFSSRGITQDGVAKPEIVAPGRKIVAPIGKKDSKIAKQFKDRVSEVAVGKDKKGKSYYVRLSGTSMAAPIVAGAAALLLERYPALTPDQVKWVLVASARAYTGQPDEAGALDVAAAFRLAAAGNVPSANVGVTPARDLPATTRIVGGGTGETTAAYWDAAYWDAAYWDAAYWDAAYWDQAGWDNMPDLD